MEYSKYYSELMTAIFEYKEDNEVENIVSCFGSRHVGFFSHGCG